MSATFIRVKVGTAGEGYEYDPENGYYHEYVVDSADDIDDLPTGGDDTVTGKDKPRPGSRCYVTATGDTYVLSVDRTWTAPASEDAPEETEE